MLYAKLNADNTAVEQYPYSIPQARADNPKKSLPRSPTEAQLLSLNVVPVQAVPKPENTPKYMYAETTPTWDGSAWVQTYTETARTLDQRKAAMIEKLKQTFATKRDAGTTIDLGAGDVAIKTDPQARSDVVSLYDDLVQREADGEVDPTQTFATAQYVVVSDCTIAQAKALRDAVAAHWRSVWARDAELGAAINAAADSAALDLIDIQAGTIDGQGGW